MSPIWTLIVSVLGAAGVSLIGAFASRRKTSSEAGNLDAQTSALMSKSARDWIADQNRHVDELTASVADLRSRLTNAEAAATVAHTAALAARESEARCLVRLDEMQVQINDLRKQLQHPPTTQEKPTP